MHRGFLFSLDHPSKWWELHMWRAALHTFFFSSITVSTCDKGRSGYGSSLTDRWSNPEGGHKVMGGGGWQKMHPWGGACITNTVCCDLVLFSDVHVPRRQRCQNSKSLSNTSICTWIWRILIYFLLEHPTFFIFSLLLAFSSFYIQILHCEGWICSSRLSQ